MHVHHEVKSFESQFKIYQEVTEYGAILDDPQTAASQIRKAIEVALQVQAAGLSRSPARHGLRRHRRFRPSVEQVELQVDEGAVGEAVAGNRRPA